MNHSICVPYWRIVVEVGPCHGVHYVGCPCPVLFVYNLQRWVQARHHCDDSLERKGGKVLTKVLK